MKQLFLSLLLTVGIFAENSCLTKEYSACSDHDLFDLEFSLITTSNNKEQILLEVVTVEEKPNLAPLILKSKEISFEDGSGKIELTICHDKEACCAQAFGKRSGLFYFKKGFEELPEGSYLIKINNRVYGQLYLSGNVAFQPYGRIE